MDEQMRKLAVEDVVSSFLKIYEVSLRAIETWDFSYKGALLVTQKSLPVEAEAAAKQVETVGMQYEVWRTNLTSVQGEIKPWASQDVKNRKIPNLGS